VGPNHDTNCTTPADTQWQEEGRLFFCHMSFVVTDSVLPFLFLNPGVGGRMSVSKPQNIRMSRHFLARKHEPVQSKIAIHLFDL
jgi:hypothetical protein